MRRYGKPLRKSASCFSRVGSDVEQLLANIHKFAFFSDLSEAVGRLHGKTVDELLAENADSFFLEEIQVGLG